MSNSGLVTNVFAATVCTPNVDSYVEGPGSLIQGKTAGNEVARIFDRLGPNVQNQ